MSCAIQTAASGSAGRSNAFAISARLGLPEEGRADILNVKVDPLFLGSLLDMPGFYPAYHMNKLHWVSLLLDGPLGEEDILPLLGMSYETVACKGRKKGGKKP